MKFILLKAFVHKTDNVLLQLFRYGFVALAAFAVDFGGLVFLKEAFGINYLVAATISFLAGAVVNFLLSIRWIFSDSKYKRHIEFVVVIIIGAIGLGLNDLLLWIFTAKFGLFYIVSKLIATVIIFFWNFFARKHLVYGSQYERA